MTERAVACLVSSDFAATEKFYRYLGFEAQPSLGGGLYLRRGAVELLFTARAEPLAWDEDRVAVILVEDVAAWRTLFARTRMRWKAMGRPGLTEISRGAWDGPAFNLSDRDGNLIWIVQQPPALSA